MKVALLKGLRLQLLLRVIHFQMRRLQKVMDNIKLLEQEYQIEVRNILNAYNELLNSLLIQVLTS